jgi:ligand-binding SRPBCC domain-containing protein
MLDAFIRRAILASDAMMRIYTLDCELVTTASLEDTFKVFENPYNLARITPAWLGLRILSPDLSMRKGLEIDYELRWLGIPMRWRTSITEYEPPFFFVDEAVRSPYALWRHRHTFKPAAEGTVVADHVDYALPLGPVGGMVNALAVARQLKHIFAYRQQAIARLLGGGVSRVREPVTG